MKTTTPIPHHSLATPTERALFELFLQFLRTLQQSPIAATFFSEKHIDPAQHEGKSDSTTFYHTVQESLRARRLRRPSTISDLRSYTSRILRKSQWHNRDLRSITRTECKELLNVHFRKSNHVYSKARTILHSLFAYGIHQGWCDFNPVDGTESVQLTEETVNILTLKQIRAFLQALETPGMQVMSPAIRLMLWCGIRPHEVQRLKWKDIDYREGVVYVDSQASKTGGARAVPLRGAATVLKNCKDMPPQQFIAPRNWQRLWATLRKRAGMSNWQRDAMRHTFASYHLKAFHNINLLQEEMGHRDSNLLRTRYLNMRNLTTNAATAFFKMR